MNKIQLYLGDSCSGTFTAPSECSFLTLSTICDGGCVWGNTCKESVLSASCGCLNAKDCDAYNGMLLEWRFYLLPKTFRCKGQLILEDFCSYFLTVSGYIYLSDSNISGFFH